MSTARQRVDIKSAPGTCRLHVEETETRDAIVTPMPSSRTIAYVAIGAEAWGPLLAAAPELLELARQYASECGDCAGVGITIEDEDCPECKYVRDLIARTECFAHAKETQHGS